MLQISWVSTCMAVELRNRNVAAVIVTTDLSAGVQTGSRVDVTVSALGDAPSLMGGTLLITQLQAPDGDDLRERARRGLRNRLRDGRPGRDAVARGANRGPRSERRDRRAGDRRAARSIALDARIKEPGLCDCGPDRGRNQRVRVAGDSALERRYEVDSRSVELFRPQVSFARFMAEVGELQVQPDMAARVVLDARTGTVVVGQDVQISTVAVTYGTLTVRVTERPQVSQPTLLARPHRRHSKHQDRSRNRAAGPIAIVGGSSLRTLVSRPQSHRRQAAGNHRNSAGDQDRRRATGRSGDPVIPKTISSGQPSASRGAEDAGQFRGRSMPISRLPRRHRLTISLFALVCVACLGQPRRSAGRPRARTRRSRSPRRTNRATRMPAATAPTSPPRSPKRASPGRPKRLNELDAQVRQRIADLEKTEAAARDWCQTRRG